MRQISHLAALCLIAIPGVALAGANKTWVSGTGTDSGACAITTPCKSFQYAYNQTSAGGEIDVKDAGGYGTIVISKPITIIAEGVLASISVPQGGTGILVSAGTNDVVTLRGLTIDGHGVGQYGVRATQAGQLIVENTIVQGVTGVGIAFDNGGGGVRYMSVSSVIARNNAIGIRKSGGYNFEGNYTDSIFSHNATGLSINGGNSTITHCVFEFNTTNGIDNEYDSATISNSTFANNANEYFNHLFSYGDNVIKDFNTDGTLQGGVQKR